MIFMKKIVHFWHLNKTGYGPTDGPSNHPTDGRTDTPSYRDARTHLQSAYGTLSPSGPLPRTLTLRSRTVRPILLTNGHGRNEETGRRFDTESENRDNAFEYESEREMHQSCPHTGTGVPFDKEG